jgi:predicted NBD/HSP70 family sugar kinase
VASLAGSSRLLRALNEAAALGHLLDRGSLTRGELRELTGLAKPTTSDVLRRLRAADLVTVVGRTSGGPGPNAEVYAVNPDAGYAAAVVLRASSVTAAVCDLSGTVRIRRVAPPADDPVQAVAETVQAACRQARVAVRRLGHVRLGWSGSDLTTPLRARLRTDVAVDSEANLAAVAERAAGTTGFALLWLGDDGPGLAVDLDGMPRDTGDIGRLPVPDEHGIRREFRDLVSGSALRELAARHTSSAAVQAALAERIAVGLAAIVAVLDPPLVVLAGDIGQAGGAPLAEAVSAALRRLSVWHTRVEPTAVTGDPVLLGATDAALASVRASLLDRIGGQR